MTWTRRPDPGSPTDGEKVNELVHEVILRLKKSHPEIWPIILRGALLTAAREAWDSGAIYALTVTPEERGLKPGPITTGGRE